MPYARNDFQDRLIAAGLRLTSGAGSSVLVAGTIAVANTHINANSLVYLSRGATGGTLGHLSVQINAGTGFTINSSSTTDTSTVNWLVIETS